MVTKRGGFFGQVEESKEKTEKQERVFESLKGLLVSASRGGGKVLFLVFVWWGREFFEGSRFWYWRESKVGANF